jgi:AcrR family transcriptional regulator
MTTTQQAPATGRSYGGRTADQRDAERRRRLLGASLDLIGTKGYAAATIERICATANVSTRHFYLIYDSKESAFIDLYDQLTAASYRKVEASLTETQGRGLDERVAKAFMAYVGPMLDDERVARISFVEIIGASPRIEELRLRYRERLVDLVRAETAGPAARGEVRDRDFRFATLALAGAATAVAHDWMLQPDRAPVQQLERQLMQLATDLIVN